MLCMEEWEVTLRMNGQEVADAAGLAAECPERDAVVQLFMDRGWALCTMACADGLPPLPKGVAVAPALSILRVVR